MVEKNTGTKSALAELKYAAIEATKVIAQATEAAAKTLGTAADKATSTIASAALDATKLIASNAADAMKINSVKSSDDHDLLIRLEENMKGLKADIKDLKDGTTLKIENHELRLNSLESSKTRQNVMMSIGIGLLSLLVGLLLFHLFKVS